jgi:hypothetical protein
LLEALNDEEEHQMARTGQQEAPEELEVEATQQDATEELEVGGAQQEAWEGTSSKEAEDGGGQPQVTYR